MFTQTEMKIAAAIVTAGARRLKLAGVREIQMGLGRRRQVGGAPQQPGHGRGNRIERLSDASRVAMPLASAGKLGNARSQSSGNSRRCMHSICEASAGCWVR